MIHGSWPAYILLSVESALDLLLLFYPLEHQYVTLLHTYMGCQTSTVFHFNINSIS